MLDAGAVDPEWGLAETAPPYQPGRQPRLLDRVRSALRTRHMSRRTGEAYVFWKRHPSEMGAPEVTAFLSSLATERRVAASTQN